MVYHLLSSEYISEQNGCGCTYFRGPDNKCLLHDHEFYELVLTVNENVIHEIKGERIKLSKHTLMLIRPHDMHRFVDEGQGEFSYVNLAFTASTFDDIAKYLSAERIMEKLSSSNRPPYVELTESQGMSMINQFLGLMGESSVPEPRVYSRALIASVFSKYFLNNIEHGAHSESPQWLSSLCAEMHKIENFSQSSDIMSRISGRSYGHICHSFKKYLGTTPTKYTNEIRLKYAKNMILHTNMTVLDVAYECGFENMGYFHRLFKQKFGASPGELRKHTSINPVM